MTTQEAIDYFGGRKKLAKALGISPNATYQWNAHPPRLRQFEIERISGGEMKIEN